MWLITSLAQMILPVALLIWVLAKWLPERNYRWGYKLLLAALVSIIAFALIEIVYAIQTDMAGNTHDIRGVISWIGPLWITIPIVVVGDALLYIGGRTIHQATNNDSRRTGKVLVFCGCVLWLGVALFHFFVIILYGMSGV